MFHRLALAGLVALVPFALGSSIRLNSTGHLFPNPRSQFLNYPYHLVEGDLDQDGRVDLVVSGIPPGTATVLLGNGDGTFSRLIGGSYDMGRDPASLLLADLNHDGNPDLVTANGPLGNISIRFGEGAGRFGVESRLKAGLVPVALTAEDLDEDGNRDLVVANRVSEDISVLLGQGEGRFAPQVRIPVGSQPYQVAAGDIDTDGHLDVVVTLCAADGSSGGFARLRGDGSGGLVLQPGRVGSACLFLSALKDLSGDQVPDLVAGRVSQYWNEGGFWTWLGKGDGTFGAAQLTATTWSPHSLEVADVGGDGIPDVIISESHDGVTLLTGRSDGTFQPPTVLPVGGYFMGEVTAADFDGDGRRDLAMADSGSYSAGVLLNGPGGFRTPMAFPSGNEPSSVAIADLNGDGSPDLAVPNRSSDNIGIHIGDGSGSFRLAALVSPVNGARNIAVDDFNRDGALDFAVSGYDSQVSVVLGVGNGTFGVPAPIPTAGSTNPILAADFNHDGKADLAVGSEIPFIHDDLSVLLGNGDGTFGPENRFGIGDGAFSLTAGDFNRDGNLDLAAANFSSNDVSVLLGNGDGTFAPEARIPHINYRAESIAAVDVDDDGNLDLLLWTSLGHLEVGTGNGDGTFNSWKIVQPGPPARGGGGMVVRDFDGDGKLDVAAGDSSSKDLTVFLGRGSGEFIPAGRFGTGTAPTFLDAADVNRDGRPDVVVVDSSASYRPGVVVLLNQGVGDADGDGIPDSTDECTDSDGDNLGEPGFPASTCPHDLCPGARSDPSGDADGDGWGDGCDNCPDLVNGEQLDRDLDGQGDSCDGCLDTDRDGFADLYSAALTCEEDNCAAVFNASQADNDWDRVGDACDLCPYTADIDQRDADLDGRGDACDPCPYDPAPSDADGDHYPACAGDCDDSNPSRFPNNPEICDGVDNDCDNYVDETFAETDSDRVPDCRDNCALVWNDTQADGDGDGIGDVCEPSALLARANLSTEGFSALRIDGRDLEIFAAAYGTCPGQIGFHPGANLDLVPAALWGSCVGMSDFHLFMNEFGKEP